MKIEINDKILIFGKNRNPKRNIETEGFPVIYQGKAFLANFTNEYYIDRTKGFIVELRNIFGKKIKNVGSKEIKIYPLQYWVIFKEKDLKNT